MNIILGIIGFMTGATTVSVLLSELTGGLTLPVVWFSFIFGIGLGYFFARSTKNLQWDLGKPGYFDWAMAFCFLLFCYRFFGWLIFSRAGGVFTLDANNFGDLPWHITSIENLAKTLVFWPENPIMVGEKFHYPFGIDMFTALFVKLGAFLPSILSIMGFFCGLLLIATLYLWGRGFALGGFLFSGGIAGFNIFWTQNWKDFQADLAWKNLPLALYLTQRGFLYAFPAGLLILWSWRRKFLLSKEGLPWWVEGLLWGTMPLFHVHTFLFLSALFAVWSLHSKNWKETGKVFGVAVLPATVEMLGLTDSFRRASVLQWKPGWMISFNHKGFLSILDLVSFFWVNYGLFFPLTLIAIFLALKTKKERWDLVILPAAAIFIICLFVMFAPWDWDNTKLMAWCYILALPVIWDLDIRPISEWLQVPLIFCLFLSGFVCLFSVYNGQGFSLYQRETVEDVCKVLSDLPHEVRIAIAQEHNHPVLLCGHMAVAGYAGHLWSHGIPGHEIVEDKLRRLMHGDGDWKRLAFELKARYLFWGPSEEQKYGGSSKPWEKSTPKVAEGSWGALYDLGEIAK